MDLSADQPIGKETVSYRDEREWEDMFVCWS
jgi:hypothetical protein